MVMKHLMSGLVLLVGVTGTAFGQTSSTNDSPVHPGTAILDSMGIVAGAPDQASKGNVQDTAATPSVRATPTSSTGRQP